MLICGLKLNHDSSIALVDNGKLIFSYETEKLNNNERYSEFILGFTDVMKIFEAHNYKLQDVDKLVIDGWHEGIPDRFQHFPNLAMAKYGTCIVGEDVLDNTIDFQMPLRGLDISCRSYKHIAGHVFASYCTSPFAKADTGSFILAWDGGMLPQLFYYKPGEKRVHNIANLFPLTVNVYVRFANRLEPFKGMEDLPLPGKAMAFASLGKILPELFPVFETAMDYREYSHEISIPEAEKLNTQYVVRLKNTGIFEKHSPADLMATFQKYLEILLVERLEKAVRSFSGESNLCITGGAGLNIVWNNAIRNSGIFNDVWVPPFPNDTGSAIGTACCEMLISEGRYALDWNVYSGPPIIDNGVNSQWEKHTCSIKELASLVHETGEPVIFLNGSAELGPRALGNRSILAAPTDVAMKHLINIVKDREHFRPVAPICMEEDAPIVFDPGTPDPYMLFTHDVRQEWLHRVPAICHVDKSARLQTINRRQNPVVYELLEAYKELSSIPLLCNTSANLKGKGFFPDVETALKWGKIHMVWCNGTLHIRKGYPKHLYRLQMFKSTLPELEPIAP